MVNERRINLLFEDCLIEEDKMYFFEYTFNALFCMNLLNYEIELLGIIPGEKFDVDRLVTKIIKYGAELYLIPMKAKNVWIYNLDSKEWISIELPDDKNGKLSNKFFQAIFYERKIYMIGSGYPGIVRIDLEDKSLKFLEQIYVPLTESYKRLGDCYIRTDYVRINDTLFFASCISNHVLKFELKDETYEWIEVGDEGNRYVGIAWDGNDFWLAPRTRNAIIKWDGECVISERMLPDCFNKDIYYFLGIMYEAEKQKLYMPGMSDYKTVIVNAENINDYEIVNKKYMMMKHYDCDYVSIEANSHLLIKRNGQVVFDNICSIRRKDIYECYRLQRKPTENRVIGLQELLDYVKK